MALETIKKVNVNSYTKVGELTRAIETWEKVEKSTTDPEQKRIAKEQINKTTQSKAHLINIIQSKFGFLCEESKYKVANLLKDDGKHKYDNLSIEVMNKYLDQEHQIYADEQTLNAEDSWGMKLLEGKTGVDYMTVVKSTMAISAISLLAQGGVFGGISAAISAIMAFNPVVGVCVIALGAATLIKMARKIFAPEIKKLCAYERVRQKFDQVESSSETEVNMDEYKSEKWAEKASPRETGKPAPEPKTPEGFASYRKRIAEEAYKAALNGEEYEAPYGDHMIQNDELREIVDAAKAEAIKELQERVAEEKAKQKEEKTEEKVEEKTEEKTEETKVEEKTPSNKEMGAALDKDRKALEELDKQVTKLREEMNKALKEYHEAKTEGKVSNKKLGEKWDTAQRLVEQYNILEKNYKQQKAEYEAKQAKFDEAVKGINPQPQEKNEAKPEEKATTEQPKETEAGTPTQNANEPPLLKASLGERYRKVADSIDQSKKAGGQGNAQTAYNNFMTTYRSILKSLVAGETTQERSVKGCGKESLSIDNIIMDAKSQALKGIQNLKEAELRDSYNDLFVSLEGLVKETTAAIKQNNDKSQSKEIVQQHLTGAGFTQEEIDEMLKSQQQQ